MQVEIPETRYAKTVDGVHIAYQVLGEGPTDLVVTLGQVSHVDLAWDLPEFVGFLTRLTSFSRVIFFDPRGNGCSDRSIDGNPFEAGMDDVRAVMDAAGSERAVQFGFQDGGMVCALFAATFPHRTSGLIFMNSPARGLAAPDYPWAWSREEWDANSAWIDAAWGTSAFTEEWLRWLSPNHLIDRATVTRLGRFFRSAGSPGSMITLNAMLRDADVRAILPTIQVPTLVLHATDNPIEPVEAGRYIAAHIHGATLVEIPVADHMLIWEAADEAVGNIERFTRQIQHDEAEVDRALATVLYTDIADSTAKGRRNGHRAWTDVRSQHDQIVRANLGRFRGREIKTMGDGFLATFDGPARGVRCAEAIVSGVRPLGIEIRAGLHTGEVAFEADDIAGLGVAIGARVGAQAGPNEVLVSQTVKDLVAGSGLTFEDAGEHELKGVPDRWRLYRVVG